MPFLEALAIEVGSSVIKSVLNIWLKDNSIASEAPSAIANLFKSETSDFLARRWGRSLD
jgi:hypothetical protein